MLFDALKVQEMIGEQIAELAKPAFVAIIKHLKHHTNKVQWMAMCTLSPIARFYPETTFRQLTKILNAMNNGSIISRDHGFKILVDLYQVQAYQDQLLPLMEEQLLIAPDNQLGQYTEKWIPAIEKVHIRNLIRILHQREGELIQPAHQKRISKNLRSLTKLLH